MERNPIIQAELEEARRYPIVIVWSDSDQIYIATIPDLDALQKHTERRLPGPLKRRSRLSLIGCTKIAKRGIPSLSPVLHCRCARRIAGSHPPLVNVLKFPLHLSSLAYLTNASISFWNTCKGVIDIYMNYCRIPINN